MVAFNKHCHKKRFKDNEGVTKSRGNMGDGAGTLAGGGNVVMDIGPTTPIRDENGKHRPVLSPTAAVFTPECELAIALRLLAFVPECNVATDLMPNVKGPPAVSLLETGTSESIGHDIEIEEKG